MKKIVFPIFIIFLLISCGKEDAGVPTAINPIGQSPDPTEVDNIEPVVGACDLFSGDHNEEVEKFKLAFSKEQKTCAEGKKLKIEREKALLKTYELAKELFTDFQGDAHKSCMNLAKNFLKRNYQIEYRKNLPENDNRVVQNILAKSSLDNILRRAISRGCLRNFDSLSYGHNGEDHSLVFDSNFLMNPSFEYFRVEGEKGFKVLGKEWALASSKYIPGWKVKAVKENPGLNCDLLEIQGVGVVTNEVFGKHMVELKSHCLNKEGKRIPGGDARVEISQVVPVKEMGVYHLDFKAQKRLGVHGVLEVALYQRKKDKTFEVVDLGDKPTWQSQCLEFEVLDEAKPVHISLQDNQKNGHKTMGVLLDDLSFSKGPCE